MFSIRRLLGLGLLGVLLATSVPVFAAPQRSGKKGGKKGGSKRGGKKSAPKGGGGRGGSH
jgi:hypothetical protein